MDWSNFFIATAGASATLLGLLFLAIQLHGDTLSADPYSRWQALARSTFDHFTVLFLLSLMMLIPGLGKNTYGPIVMVIVLGGIARLIFVWGPLWRRVFRTRREQVTEMVWMLATPMVVDVALGQNALQAWRTGISPQIQENIGFCIVGLFAIMLRNSWKLLIEVAFRSPTDSK